MFILVEKKKFSASEQLLRSSSLLPIVCLEVILPRPLAGDFAVTVVFGLTSGGVLPCLLGLGGNWTLRARSLVRWSPSQSWAYTIACAFSVLWDYFAALWEEFDGAIGGFGLFYQG